MIFEIFEPYLLFISFFISVIVNIYLIVKRVNWIIIIVANLLVVVIMEFFGLSSYNIISVLINGIIDIIVDIFNGISDAIKSFFNSLKFW